MSKKKYVCTGNKVELDGKIYNKGDIVFHEGHLNVTFFTEVEEKKKKSKKRR